MRFPFTLPTLSPACRKTLWQAYWWRVYLAASILALTGSTAGADPNRPQCWDCVQRLAMELPAVNPQEDPLYEQGLTAGSVLPALAKCSLDDGELPVLQQIIGVFTDALVDGGGAGYVRDHLEQIPQVSVDDRVKLTDGAKQSLIPRFVT
ncbi:MAG TPA: hypothetical protein VGI78_11280 [Acetobacteraceae bacterium]|jgi:hypothetical protein